MGCSIDETLLLLSPYIFFFIQIPTTNHSLKLPEHLPISLHIHGSFPNFNIFTVLPSILSFSKTLNKGVLTETVKHEEIMIVSYSGYMCLLNIYR